MFLELCGITSLSDILVLRGFMGQRFLLFMAILLWPGFAPSGIAACLVTLPPNPPFAPPAPYNELRLSGERFWYGTDALWTQMVADGVWHITNNVDKHNGYADKLIFWAKGFDWRKEPEPELIVTAQRVDGEAPSVAVAHANAVFVSGNTPAMMTLIRIPTAGCWEVTGYYGGHKLTFTVSVQP